MNEGITVLIWLVLIGALAIPVIWVAWVFLKRVRASEKTEDNPPKSSNETTED